MFISREKIRKHRRWWLFLFVWLPMTVVAVLWFGFSPNVPNQAIRAERDASGNFIDRLLGDDQPSAATATFEAQFGKLNAHNNMMSSLSSTASNPSYLADGHVAIINYSDHTLMKRVGGLILERLKQQPSLQRIDYYPLGESIAPGEPAPDVFVALQLDNLEESGLLIEHRLQAKIDITASDNLVRSHNSYFDNLTPPKIEFDWHGTLEHDSTTTGIGSSAAKYKLAAEDIAKHIAKALIKQLDDLRKKHGPLPAIPAPFYPAFQPVEPLPFLEKWKAEALFSGHGLMNRNQSVWKFRSDKPPNNVLRAIAEELQGQDWKVPALNADQIVQHVRAKRNSVVLEIFPDHESRTDLDINGKRNGKDQPRLFTYYATYLDRMQHEEILTACEAFLSEEPPAETLIVFNRHWFGNPELEQRLLAYLQARSTTSPDALIAAAELLHRLKRDEEAQQAMLAANAISQATSDPTKYNNRLKQLAKTMKIEDFPPKTIDIDVLRKLGVRQINLESQFPELEFAIAEPAIFFYVDPDNHIKLFSYRVVPTGAHQFEFHFVVSALGEGSREWGRGGHVSEDRWSSIIKRLGSGNEGEQVRFYVRKVPGQPRIQAALDVIRRDEPQPPPPYE